MREPANRRFEASQLWRYRAPAGFEKSRIVIGAIADFGTLVAPLPGTAASEAARIVCVSVLGCPRREPAGGLVLSNIPFLPMTEAALAATVTDLEGTADPLDGFAQALKLWSEDERGLSMFTVPFEGRLDLLIARQMRELVGDAA